MPGIREIVLLIIIPAALLGLVLAILYFTGVLGGRKNKH